MRKVSRKRNLFYFSIFLGFIVLFWTLTRHHSIQFQDSSNKTIEQNPQSYSNQLLSNVSPEQFGADGFDDKLDTKALQAAINKSSKVTLKNGATYIIDKPLTCNHAITIVSEDESKSPAVILQKNKTSAFIFENKPVNTTNVIEKMSKNDRYVVLENTKGMKQGGLLHLKSDKLWYWDNRDYLTKGGLYKITKIRNQKVYLDRDLSESYDIGINENVTVDAYANHEINLKGISFTHPLPYDSKMVVIHFSSNATISDVSISNSKLTGIFLNKTFATTIQDVNINLGVTKKTKLGYGIQDYGGSGTIIQNSIFKNVRRGVDFSGDTPSRYGIVSDSKVFGAKKGSLAPGNSGFGTHSTAEHILFKNNYVVNFNQAFLVRGNEITIKNNIHTGKSNYFLSLGYGNHVTLQNNIYKSTTNDSLKSFVLIQNSYFGSLIAEGNRSGDNPTFIGGNLKHLEKLALQKKISIN
ncbi:right-handed parallel beta-helix repeat-containing protein [Neobacillus sp. NPDC058068]|uniref:right-handed parallel beta-helix repeat-containing protein n=1 Tax=Neobacillus sp. NPDC058068 TaxID=3346325 RepID=UPI0036DB076B